MKRQSGIGSAACQHLPAARLQRSSACSRSQQSASVDYIRWQEQMLNHNWGDKARTAASRICQIEKPPNSSCLWVPKMDVCVCSSKSTYLMRRKQEHSAADCFNCYLFSLSLSNINIDEALTETHDRVNSTTMLDVIHFSRKNASCVFHYRQETLHRKQQKSITFHFHYEAAHHQPAIPPEETR